MTSTTLARPARSLRQVLFETYWRLERHITPGLRSSQYFFADRLIEAMADHPSWLDIGCGRRPFPEWMPEYEVRVVSAAGHATGVDPDCGSLRDHHAYRHKLAATAEQLPFPAATFDVASANMVVEHLSEPASTLTEIRRVLKPAGRFVFHTPNRLHWPLWIGARTPETIKLGFVKYLEGRAPEDVFPTHYKMNDPKAIAAAAASAGFEVERLDLVSTSAITVMLGPLVLPELAWIRLLRRPAFARLRSNIVATLRRR